MVSLHRNGSVWDRNERIRQNDNWEKVEDWINGNMDGDVFQEWFNQNAPSMEGVWDSTKEYEGLSIVTYQGASYTSKKRVPVGIDILNEEFWSVTGNYNAQVEYYRDEVRNLQSTVENISIQVFSNGSDDTQTLSNAIDKAMNINADIYLPDEKYYISLERQAENVRIYGSGNTLIVPVGDGRNVIHLTGNNNTLENFNVEVDAFQCNRPIGCVGDYNAIEKIRIYDPEKSVSQSMEYGRVLITIDGNYNKVAWNEAYNGYTGIGNSGKGNKIIHNYVHDNMTGMRLSSNSRQVEIGMNLIIDNNVNTQSGADGILSSRNGSHIWIHHNTIINSGEHGLYFQGDNSIIESNIVTDNHGSGIKLASYNTDLSGWDEAEKGAYIGHNNIIRGNITRHNGATGSGNNGGIYLQSPLKNILVEGNINEDEPYFGIRGILMGDDDLETGTPYSVLDDIKIIGNVSDAPISGAFRNGAVIHSNNVTSTISIAGNSSYPSINPVVRDNVMADFQINNSQGLLLKDNEMDDFSLITSSSENKVIGNTVKNIISSRNITNCSVFDHNDITLVGTAQLTTPTGVAFKCDSISYNTFTRISTDETEITSYLLAAPWQTFIRNCRIVGNTFNAPEEQRNVRLWAEKCVIKDNIFYNAAERNMDIYASDTLISGNTGMNAIARIHMNTAEAPTNTIVNNNTDISTSGEQGIIANNRPDWVV